MYRITKITFSEKTKVPPSCNALTGIAREGDGQPVRGAALTGRPVRAACKAELVP